MSRKLLLIDLKDGTKSILRVSIVQWIREYMPSLPCFLTPIPGYAEFLRNASWLLLHTPSNAIVPGKLFSEPKPRFFLDLKILAGNLATFP